MIEGHKLTCLFEDKKICSMSVILQNSTIIDNEKVWHNIFDRSTFQNLKQNDECITNLSVAFDEDHDGPCFFISVNWKEDGDCIAHNTQLKRLVIDSLELEEEGHNECTRQQLQDFFSCIHRNSSIHHIQFRKLIINDKFGGELIEELCGHPSLVRLEFHAYNYNYKQHRLGSSGCIAIGKVLKHPNCKLKDLRLSNCQLNDETLGIVCDALLGNSAINTLHLDGNKDITSSGWRIVSYVLQHPNCNLIELDLNDTALDDKKSDIFASALSGTSSLKILNISRNQGISSTGWQTLFNQLSQSSIESLNISNNIFNDSDLNMLANVSTLKSLDMTGVSCTPIVWRSYFNLLQTRRTQLVKLDVSYNQIGNVGATALGNLLRNMVTLKTLIMHAMTYPRDRSEEISSQGWQAFFTILQDSNMSLVKLSLWNNIIDDEGMQLLVRLVSRMSSLKFLDLSDRQLVTPVGWQALSDYLQSPNFSLTHLDLNDNNINDDTVVAFANALTHNKTLERFHLYACTDYHRNDEMI